MSTNTPQASVDPEETTDNSEEFVDELLSRGDDLADAENYQGALGMYEAAMEEVGSNARLKASVLFSIGRAHEQLRDFRAAYDALSNAVTEAPGNDHYVEAQERVASQL
ncbi:hypothetical protein KKA95_00500 [Patescibacteria group bacterium]|nr:hypothetical protein [Patescibacteria group bacterium]